MVVARMSPSPTADRHEALREGMEKALAARLPRLRVLMARHFPRMPSKMHVNDLARLAQEPPPDFVRARAALMKDLALVALDGAADAFREEVERRYGVPAAANLLRRGQETYADVARRLGDDALRLFWSERGGYSYRTRWQSDARTWAGLYRALQEHRLHLRALRQETARLASARKSLPQARRELLAFERLGRRALRSAPRAKRQFLRTIDDVRRGWEASPLAASADLRAQGEEEDDREELLALLLLLLNQEQLDELLEAIQLGDELLVEQLVREFVEDVASRTVEWTVRTELNRLFRDLSLALYRTFPFVAAARWRLSPAHKVRDRCDTYATQDLYGLGAGVYPLNRVPTEHVNGWCYVVPVFLPRSD